mgnify:CR=1 FL=1
MESIKTVKVTSRRSTKIKDDFFTEEMTVEADVSGIKDKQKHIDKLWDYVEGEVDKRLAQTYKDILDKK